MAETSGGVLCFYKPKGCTSHDSVNRIRRLFSTKQVGHTGTLDPMAEGVLPVMIGRAVKAAEFLSSDTKEYAASIKLGLTTDTEDISGTVLSEYSGNMPPEETVRQAVSLFVGEISQVPPMYSALKVNGHKLVDLARKGKEVDRTPRTVFVEKAEVYPTGKNNEYRLAVRVSKGTYIRTLCADIGKKLGTGAVMSSLVRTRSGNFGIEDAITQQSLEAMTEEERYRLLKPVDSLFGDCPAIVLPEFFARLGLCGCELYQKKLKTDFPDGSLVRLYDKDGFFALGKVTEYKDGSAVKPVKQFRIS